MLSLMTPFGPIHYEGQDNLLPTRQSWRLRKQGLRGVVGAAGSAVFVATGRIVAEYPELQFW
jgi:hypothetical protein